MVIHKLPKTIHTQQTLVETLGSLSKFSINAFNKLSRFAPSKAASGTCSQILLNVHATESRTTTLGSFIKPNRTGIACNQNIFIMRNCKQMGFLHEICIHGAMVQCFQIKHNKSCISRQLRKCAHYRANLCKALSICPLF